MKVKIHELECTRCGHKWIPRKSDVRLCAKCKTPYWETPKTSKEVENANQ